MNKLMSALAVASLSFGLVGCMTPNGPRGQEVGIAGGAIAGGALGAAVSHSNPVAAVGGAVVGGLIGNEMGKEYDYRHGRYNRYAY